MMKRHALLTLVICLVAPGALNRVARAQEFHTFSNSPVVVYLCAWLPEIGCSPGPLTPQENALERSAQLARRGDFAGSLLTLRRLLTAAPNVEIKYLALFFQRELIQRRNWIGQEGMFVAGEAALDDALERSEYSRLTDQIGSIASAAGAWDLQQATAINLYSQFFNSCFVMLPQMLRNQHLTTENGKPSSPAVGLIESQCLTFPEYAKRTPDLNVLDSTSFQLLALLVETRISRAEWDFRRAAVTLEEGARLSDEKLLHSTAAEWFLERGDLDVAPFGSPVSFGYDLGSENGVRALRASGFYPKPMASLNAGAIENAHIWYGQAIGVPAPVTSVRTAYTAFLRHGSNAGALYDKAAVLAERDGWPRLAAMAFACEALIQKQPPLFEKALGIASQQKDLGTVLGMTELAESYATRLEAYGDPKLAVEVLRIPVRGLFAYNHERAAAELLYASYSVDARLGRGDFALEELMQSIDAERAWVARIQAELNGAGAASSDEAALGNERNKLAYRLVLLCGELYQRSLFEGLEKWKVILNRYEGEVRVLAQENPNPNLKATWQSYLTQKKQIMRSFSEAMASQRSDCGQLIRLYNLHSKELSTDLAEWERNAVAASFCSDAIRTRAGQALSSLNPVEAVNEASQHERDQPSLQSYQHLSMAIQGLGFYVDAALSLGRGDLVERRTEELSDLIPRFQPLLTRLEPYNELYLALAFIAQGKGADARKILGRLRTREPFWSLESDPSFHIRVTGALIQADFLTEQYDEALLAVEWLRVETDRKNEVESGVRASDPDTARLSMLVRQAELGPVTQNEETEVRQLEARLAPIEAARAGLPGQLALVNEIRSMPVHTIMIVYAPSMSGLLAWRVERNQPIRHFRLSVNSVQFRTALTQLYSHVLDREDGWQAASRELYEALLKPLEPFPSGSTLAFMRMGDLDRIPFELLGPTPEHVLVISHPIAYIAHLISAVQGRVPELNPPLVVGGATLGSALIEADKIKKLLRARMLVGSDATVANVLHALPGAPIAHFAAHGVIDEANPYQSYLDLADGPLESWQLFRAVDNSGLLVLAACDTKRSPDRVLVQNGMSITALANLGGASRVISSIRPTDDADTLALMEDFYSRSLGDPAQALQAAKVNLMSTRGGDANRIADFVLTVRDTASLKFSFVQPENVAHQR